MVGVWQSPCMGSASASPMVGFIERWVRIGRISMICSMNKVDENKTDFQRVLSARAWPVLCHKNTFAPIAEDSTDDEDCLTDNQPDATVTLNPDTKLQTPTTHAARPQTNPHHKAGQQHSSSNEDIWCKDKEPTPASEGIQAFATVPSEAGRSVGIAKAGYGCSRCSKCCVGESCDRSGTNKSVTRWERTDATRGEQRAKFVQEWSVGQGHRGFRRSRIVHAS